MSFNKCIPVETKHGLALKAVFDYPYPLFELTVTPLPEIALSLVEVEYSNIAYGVLGFNKTNNCWEIYIGETGSNFASRFLATHRNSSWYKALDVNTLLFLIINVPTETTIDFRKALEYYLTQAASAVNVNTLNKTGSLETIHQGIENKEKIKQIASLTLAFAKNMRNLPSVSGKTNSNIANIKRVPTKKFPVGTKLAYRHSKFGVESEVQAIVTDENKVIMTSIKNAPLYSRYSEAGKQQFAYREKRYQALLATATINEENQTYTWTGETEPLPLTTPLAFLNGVGTANVWRKND